LAAALSVNSNGAGISVDTDSATALMDFLHLDYGMVGARCHLRPSRTL
jgi:hypothetical protein